MASNKSPITTHVLDTTHGIPAEGISVKLDFVSLNDISFTEKKFEWTTLATRLVHLCGFNSMKRFL